MTNNELLFLIKKHTDTFIEQTRTKPQELLEFKLIKQTETFCFSPPKNLVEGRKWLLASTSFEATNSVFNITNENNSFSITYTRVMVFQRRCRNYSQTTKIVKAQISR